MMNDFVYAMAATEDPENIIIVTFKNGTTANYTTQIYNLLVTDPAVEMIVSNVHPHRFRRTFATGLAKRGMDIQEVQKLLGHSGVNTTMKYINVSDSKVMASYQQYIA